MIVHPSLQERLALATVNSKCSLIFPKAHAGKKSILTMAVLIQELLLHAEKYIRHEDVVKTILLGKQTKANTGEKIDKTGGKGQSVRWKAWWRPSNIKCAVSQDCASCCVHQDCHVANEEKAALKKAAGVSGGKDECQV